MQHAILHVALIIDSELLPVSETRETTSQGIPARDASHKAQAVRVLEYPARHSPHRFARFRAISSRQQANMKAPTNRGFWDADKHAQEFSSIPA